ncbi:MAG: UDP-N-acetylmuramate dehydrogenase [Candidatus Omnitrophica bacterium]|nr:UDP-N-acetylmuramate dehydrogenase [Candidatus Omnitrophota bacterium]
MLVGLVTNWWKDLKIKIRFDVPLDKYTTFKIGGPAKYFLEPKNTEELIRAVKLLKRYPPRAKGGKLPILILGSGSNILVMDKGIEAVVIHLNSAYFKKISLKKGQRLQVGSGARLSRILSFSRRHNLSGLEFLAGIPGTLGGAIMMNAGIPDKTIADRIENVTVMDYNGRIKTLAKKEIKFTYRSSNLSKYIILSATLKLSKDKNSVKEKIKYYLKKRYLTQDLMYPSAGCIFKNPPGESAGRLIDLCGLKGKRIHDACISKRHANFILNLGKARAKDVLRLIRLVKKKVKKKFHINLEPEIKIWK